MNWIELAVYTNDDALELVYGALMGAGLLEVAIEESEERVRAHLDTLAPYWDYADPAALCASNGAVVKAYVADIPEAQALLQSARDAISALKDIGLDIGEPYIIETKLDDQDWANNWREHFKPLPIGERLLICPPWEDASQWPGRTVASIDPGMAFGTGEHQSTRLCLLLLQEYMQENDAVLDIGCGSGILAIAALLLGANSAVCVDIDPSAAKAAKDNAKANNIEHIEIYTGDILNDEELSAKISGEYDIVFANIVADVVIALCPLIPSLLAPGGRLICSGIIDERADEVKAAIKANGLSVMEEKRSGKENQAEETQWVALIAGAFRA